MEAAANWSTDRIVDEFSIAWSKTAHDRVEGGGV